MEGCVCAGAGEKYRGSGRIVVRGGENWGEEEGGKVKSEKIERRNMGEEKLSRWSELRREEKREIE